MDLIRALILGLVQALTEFLPISSSAHLILFRGWMGFDAVDGLTFDVALHIGTVLAIIVYFRRDLATLAGSAMTGGAQRRLLILLILATIPAAVAGLLFDDIIEEVFRRPEVIVVTLILGGVIFLVVERRARANADLSTLSLWTALAVGVAQSTALVPGVSRSGITIVTGMAMGLRREEAARFSFLLAIPILLGAGAKKMMDLTAVPLSGHDVSILIVGVVTSALTGWFVIRFLLRYLQSNRLDAFAYYRFALAIAIVVWLAVTG